MSVELVRGAGIEPASLAAQEPKSCAFANFASRATEKVFLLYRRKRKNQFRDTDFPSSALVSGSFTGGTSNAPVSSVPWR